MTPCNKKFYRDRKTAKSKKKRLEQMYKCKYEVYKCTECGEIHLTKKKSVGEKKFFRKERDLKK